MRTHVIPLLSMLLATTALADVREFKTPVAEGNHRVTLTIRATTQPLTVKAESRRLMIEALTIPPGQTVTRSFIVNTRTPALPDGRRVKINGREVDALHWDDQLSLEFLGDGAAVTDIQIADAPANTKTVFIAGDSTVTDQPNEPYAGWGQMLPVFLRDDVAVANYAESGRSLTSFAAELRLAKVLSVAKPGDILLIQFGHNDMKEKGEGMGAYLNFSDNLRSIIAKARAARMTPVLVTPMNRRFFNADGTVKNTFGDYVDAVRKVAAEQKTALIDLNAMSAKFYEAMGPENSRRAFVQYPADTFPNQHEALKDDTHHNNYGAYELAKCVVEGLRTNGDPTLRGMLRDGVRPFDPAKPDDLASFDVPRSPSAGSTTKPAGS